ncbi:MAG TPA: hypothetical protein PLU46_00360 [Thiotrichales bacterium]|nr:hypothetical protein [Thiotrichales bacterium]
MAFIKTIGSVVIGPMETVSDEQLADGWFEYKGVLYTFNAWDVKKKKVIEDSDALAQGVKEAVYQLLDTKAREFDYRDMNEVAGFAVQAGEWQSEAQGLLSWQTQVWTAVYAALNHPPVGALNTLLSALPVFEQGGVE